MEGRAGGKKIIEGETKLENRTIILSPVDGVDVIEMNQMNIRVEEYRRTTERWRSIALHP